MKPIAITVGEPAGIGPDIFLQWITHTLPRDYIVIADQEMLEQRAQFLKIDSNIFDKISIQHVPLAKKVLPGKPDPDNAKAILKTLDIAVAGCQNNEFSAMVTGPIHKATINNAGIQFSGHTEYLAQLTHTPRVVMMLIANQLRVALVTTHLPLAAVSAAITPTCLTETLQIVESWLKQHLLIDRPCILVCGLNPHAGENGYLGREEIDVIVPVIHRLQQQGMHVIGPLPADTLFTPRLLGQADAVIAMYHDQGLPVLKYAGFGQAVNVTLGLPIIRTSVDHGTAFDLAGSGRSDWGSFAQAVAVARDLAQMELG